MGGTRTEHPPIRLAAMALAACTAWLFVSGPAVTSNDARPLYSLGQTHIWAGVAVSILTAALAVWLWRIKERKLLQRLARVALGVNIVEGLLGLVPDPQPPIVRISHSLLAQVFFSMTVAMVVFTCETGEPPSDPAQNAGLLRFVATATPILVLSQVTLGVVFRHGVLGPLWHILWACVVAMYLVMVIAATLGAGHSAIRRAGIALAIVAGIQILIGFALFILMAMEADPAALIVLTSVHATAAALTLAAAVVLAIMVSRMVIATRRVLHIIP
jgi:heme A synthase